MSSFLDVRLYRKMKHFIRWELICDSARIFLGHKVYIYIFLCRCQLECCNCVDTCLPITAEISFFLKNKAPFDKQHQHAFRFLLRILAYLSTFTTTNFTFLVSVLSLSLCDTSLCDPSPVKYFFRYLSGTKSYELPFQKGFFVVPKILKVAVATH